MFEKDTSALERAQAYEFLAGIFLKEPSVETLEALKTWAKEGNEPQALSLLEEIQEKDPEAKELAQEYYDLFFVPVSGRFVPPFESAIRGALRQEGCKTKFGPFWGEETVKLAALYERTQFHPERLAIFPPLKQLKLPDHIGYELSYMAYLCRLEEERIKLDQSPAAIRGLQVQFLNEHLLKWLALFVEDLKLITQTGYYRYFAELARDLCQEDAEILKTALEDHVLATAQSNYEL